MAGDPAALFETSWKSPLLRVPLFSFCCCGSSLLFCEKLCDVSGGLVDTRISRQRTSVPAAYVCTRSKPQASMKIYVHST